MNAEGENHRSPLHEAASAGHVPIVELLIKEGANPCHRDNHDATPYDLAYVEGHTEVSVQPTVGVHPYMYVMYIHVHHVSTLIGNC